MYINIDQCPFFCSAIAGAIGKGWGLGLSHVVGAAACSCYEGKRDVVSEAARAFEGFDGGARILRGYAQAVAAGGQVERDDEDDFTRTVDGHGVGRNGMFAMRFVVDEDKADGGIVAHEFNLLAGDADGSAGGENLVGAVA